MTSMGQSHRFGFFVFLVVDSMGGQLVAIGGVADQTMTDFDVNNAYGIRALVGVPSSCAKQSR